jgi:hypothetical protein
VSNAGAALPVLLLNVTTVNVIVEPAFVANMYGWGGRLPIGVCRGTETSGRVFPHVS